MRQFANKTNRHGRQSQDLIVEHEAMHTFSSAVNKTSEHYLIDSELCNLCFFRVNLTQYIKCVCVEASLS